MNNELPDGWIFTELGNYIHLKNGFAFKSTEYLESSSTTVPVIRISDIQNNEVSTKLAVHVRQNDLANNFIITQGDLLIAMSGATTGKVGIYNEEKIAYQNQRVGNLKLADETTGNKKFRNYLIQSLSETITKIAYGGAQPNISGKAIEKILIPLPPLPEQHYIAERLDKLLARVDAAQTRLQGLPTQLKYYRQSVLAAAFSGQLTADWREQTGCLKNSVLQILANKNKNKQQEIEDGLDNRLPETWLDICLGDVIQYGKTSKIEPEHIKDHTWVLELEDIEKDSSRLLAKIYAPERKSKSSKNRFVKGDVLYGKLRPYLNKVLLADEDGICTTEIIPLSGNEYVSSEYLFYWLKSSQFIEYATQASYGLNMPRLGTKDGLKAPLILPPLPEQTEIVRRVEKLLAHADSVEQAVAHSLHQLALLKQSLLARAFSGELSAAWRVRQDGH